MGHDNTLILLWYLCWGRMEIINTTITTGTISHVAEGIFRHLKPGKMVLLWFFDLQHLPNMPVIMSFFTVVMHGDTQASWNESQFGLLFVLICEL